MKLIYLTDLHLQATPIPIRKDDFPTAILSKISSILVWGLNNGVDAILCGGDIFNHPRVGASILAKLARTIAMYEIPWYVVVGQHDEEGHNFESYKNTAVGILDAAMPNFTVLPNGWNNETKIIGDSTKIIGFHYQHEGEKELAGALQTAKADIAIVHQMVTKEEVPFPHVQAKVLPPTVKYVFTGDFHPGLDVQVGDCRIINPGALARLSKVKDSERVPQFIILDTEKDELEILPAPHEVDVWVGDKEEVISREEMDKLFQGLGSLNTHEFFNRQLHEQVKEVSTQLGIGHSALVAALNALTEVGGE